MDVKHTAVNCKFTAIDSDTIAYVNGKYQPLTRKRSSMTKIHLEEYNSDTIATRESIQK